MSEASAALELGAPSARTWQLHGLQREILLGPERFKVLPAGRRYGKSHVGAMWALRLAHTARLERREGVAWVVYPTYRIARTAWRKMIRLAPRGWITATVGTEEHPDTMALGGVKIEFRSAMNPESLVAEGLIGAWLDECGTIAERAWAESIRPTLVDLKAPALFTGTPKGRTWFYKMAMQGLEGGGETRSFMLSPRQGLPSALNPYLDPAELDKLAEHMTERTFRQEILAEFLASSGSAFRYASALRGQRCTEHRTISLGVDLARQFDWTVLWGFCEHGHWTHFERFNAIDWPVQKERIVQAWLRLGRPWVTLDSTGVGDPVAQDLMRMGVRLEAFEFTGKSKPQLMEALILAFDQRLLTIPDDDAVVAEFEAIEPEQTPYGYTKYAAPEGLHDDIVMACALAWRGLRRGGDLGLTFGGSYRPAASSAAAPGEQAQAGPAWVCILRSPPHMCRTGLPCSPRCGPREEKQS